MSPNLPCVTWGFCSQVPIPRRPKQALTPCCSVGISSPLTKAALPETGRRKHERPLAGAHISLLTGVAPQAQWPELRDTAQHTDALRSGPALAPEPRACWLRLAALSLPPARHLQTLAHLGRSGGRVWAALRDTRALRHPSHRPTHLTGPAAGRGGRREAPGERAACTDQRERLRGIWWL